jgi:ankyrin repeat protein
MLFSMVNQQPTSPTFDRMFKNILSNGPFYTAMWAGLLLTASTYLYLPARFSSVIGSLLIISLLNYDKWRPERKPHDAVKNGDITYVESYLKKGKNVDLKSIGGITMLHIACMEDKVDIVDLLIQYGADINATTIYSDTPLLYAVGKRNLSLVSLLLRYDAKTNLKNDEGKTPYDLAIQLDQIEIAEILRGNNAEP